MDDYYVYVYIDPRNFEEFYYGKGKGSRKNAHMGDQSDNEKTRRIKAIQKEGLDPIIRVIAKGLSEQEALLVEKTLLWKLGKHLANIAQGHYAENFRSPDTFHKEISSFDFQNNIYFYNVGQRLHRNWNDYIKYGFISAGQRTVFRDSMLGFKVGDVVAAYMSKRGYVGIGQITQEAKPINQVIIEGLPLLLHYLVCKNMGENSSDPERSEYVALVNWLSVKPISQAVWIKNSDLFVSRQVRASLDGKTKTIDFLDKEFNVNIREYIK